MLYDQYERFLLERVSAWIRVRRQAGVTDAVLKRDFARLLGDTE